MSTLVTGQQRFDEASLTTARVAQAITIEGFDRLVQLRDGLSQILPAAVSPNQRMVSRLISHHSDVVDRQYALMGHLLGLHREFAQRLFDVLSAHESSDAPEETVEASTNVISLHAPRKLR